MEQQTATDNPHRPGFSSLILANATFWQEEIRAPRPSLITQCRRTELRVPRSECLPPTIPNNDMDTDKITSDQ